tara:strand:- start:47 stop:148 length:102 start_codon:yes stop_codon:yes gene_type:complete
MNLDKPQTKGILPNATPVIAQSAMPGILRKKPA